MWVLQRSAHLKYIRFKRRINVLVINLLWASKWRRRHKLNMIQSVDVGFVALRSALFMSFSNNVCRSSLDASLSKSVSPHHMSEESKVGDNKTVLPPIRMIERIA